MNPRFLFIFVILSGVEGSRMGADISVGIFRQAQEDKNIFMKHFNLLTILLLALFLRMINLDQSLWLDEAAQALESARPLNQQYLIYADFHPPLYHYLLHFWMTMGRAEWVMRMSSVLPGVLTVFLTYLIGSKLVNKQIGRLAALLLAIAPYHIYYSQELRMYSLSTFWAAMLIYAFISRKWWLHTVALIGGLYTIYLFPFVVLAELVYLMLVGRGDPSGRSYGEQFNTFVKQWVFSCIIAGLSLTPWLPHFIKQFQGGVDLPSIWPEWKNISSVSAWKAFPLTYAKFMLGRITFSPKLLYAGLIAIGSIFFLPSIFVNFIDIGRSKLRLKLKTDILVVVLWLVIPIIIAWLLSFWVPINGPWRLLLTIPAFYLLVVIGAESISNQTLRKICISGLIFTSLFGTFTYHINSNFHREDWQSAMKFLNNQIFEDNSDTIIIQAFPEPFAPSSWYTRAELPIYGVLDSLIVEPEKLNSKLSTLMANKQTVYRFEYLQDLTDPHKLIPRWLENNGYTIEETYDFRGVGFIHEYHLEPQLADNNFNHE